MTHLPVNIGLLLAAIIFLLGLTGVLIRRNIIFMLLSLEIMMNAVALAFVVGSSHWMNVDGQVMVLFIYAVAAAEVAVGLALVLQMHRQYKTMDVNELSNLKDKEETDNNKHKKSK